MVIVGCNVANANEVEASGVYVEGDLGSERVRDDEKTALFAVEVNWQLLSNALFLPETFACILPLLFMFLAVT